MTTEEDAAAKLVAQLGQLDTCAISDALDSLGLLDFVVDGVERLSTDRRLVGRVITVQLGSPDGTPSDRHLGTTAIDAADEFSVIILGGGRDDAGGWGGLLSRAAVCRGVRGVIVDGGVRDVDEAEQIGFAVFGRRGAPRTARGRVKELSTGDPVSIGPVLVRTGDYVVADGTGVVVVPCEHIDAVVSAAERLTARETLIIAELERGVSASAALGANYEDMLDGLDPTTNSED